MKPDWKEIEIVRWVIRRPENDEGDAYLVGIDKEGREFEWEPRVYVFGEYHDIETRIIATEPTHRYDGTEVI